MTSSLAIFKTVLLCCLILGFLSSCLEKTASPPVDAGSLQWKNDVYYSEGKTFTGSFQRLHANGKIRALVDLKNGLYHGVAREYYEDGTQATEVHFAKGVRHGPNTYWREDGSLLKEQIFKRGKLISETGYKEDGSSYQREPGPGDRGH